MTHRTSRKAQIKALLAGFKELTPGLLMWLRVYRQQPPQRSA